jgi:hypothetical protein
MGTAGAGGAPTSGMSLNSVAGDWNTAPAPFVPK